MSRGQWLKRGGWMELAHAVARACSVVSHLALRTHRPEFSKAASGIVCRERGAIHADVAVGHAERQEDLLACIYVERTPVDSTDDLSQKEPRRVWVVGRLGAWVHPILNLGLTNRFDDLAGKGKVEHRNDVGERQGKWERVQTMGTLLGSTSVHRCIFDHMETSA